MEIVNNDVLCKIFSFLSKNEQFFVALVCKQFNNLIQRPLKTSFLQASCTTNRLLLALQFECNVDLLLTARHQNLIIKYTKIIENTLMKV